MFCSFARRYSAIVVLALSVLSTQLTLAVPASESLLPNTTKGMISVPDVERLEENWNKTQLGQMMMDPVMQPFVEDLKRQFKERWTKVTSTIGLTLEDLEGVPGGEVSAAIIQPSKDTAVMAILMDVTGKEVEANGLLAKVDRNMAAKKAKKEQQTVGGVKVTIYTLPLKDGQRVADKAVFFLHQDLFCGTDDPQTSIDILGRMKGDANDSLATLPAFDSIMKRVVSSAGEQIPEARWFVEPFSYVEAMRIINPQEKKRGKDMLKILSDQGFEEAIRGIGGYVHFYVDGKYEIIHRTAVHAPAVPGAIADEKYKLAARMMRFPNGGDLHPQAWVPRELSTYASFNVEIARSFEYSSTLVDAFIGEPGTFDEIIASLEKDPNGPMIKVREDLIAHLGERCTVLTDTALPVTPKSERLIVAVESTNPEAMAKTIEKTMKADPDTRKVTVAGYTVWEIVQDDMDLPDLEIDNGFDPTGGSAFDPTGGADAPEKGERRKLPNSAVCVAKGQLLVASHIDFLEKVLSEKESRQSLATSVDYALVMSELSKLFGEQRSFRFFSRSDEEVRPSYELIRAGKMPESESVLGRLLNTMFGEGKEGEVRTQKIDGSKLPDFETVRRYFGPSGLEVISEEDGWFILGVTLSKQLPQAVKVERELR